MDCRNLYLELIKKAISFSLWEQPAYPIQYDNPWRTPFKRKIVNSVQSALQRQNLQLVSLRKPSEKDIREGRFWPLLGESMIGHHRLGNLQESIECILRENIAGDLIEAGVWRGGATIFMKAVLTASGDSSRKVFVADSFEGLPEPDPDKYPEDRGDIHSQFSQLAVSREQVQSNFEKYGLLDDRVHFIKGWFSEALPKANLGPLALIRIDGDMYSSTMDALTHLYHKLTPGGFCIIDDYVFEPCKKAVTDFRSANQITEPIQEIDWTGVYWRKNT